MAWPPHEEVNPYEYQAALQGLTPTYGGNEE